MLYYPRPWRTEPGNYQEPLSRNLFSEHAFCITKRIVTRLQETYPSEHSREFPWCRVTLHNAKDLSPTPVLGIVATKQRPGRHGSGHLPNSKNVPFVVDHRTTFGTPPPAVVGARSTGPHAGLIRTSSRRISNENVPPAVRATTVVVVGAECRRTKGIAISRIHQVWVSSTPEKSRNPWNAGHAGITPAQATPFDASDAVVRTD
jgi:hypothetical protein